LTLTQAKTLSLTGLTDTLSKTATKTALAQTATDTLTKTKTETLTKTLTDTLTLTKTATLTKTKTSTLTKQTFEKPPPPTFTWKIPKPKSYGTKKRKESILSLKGGKVAGLRFAYADLLNVSKSQRLYGKGTSPSRARPQTREAIAKYGYRLKTVEQLNFGKKQRNINIFGGSNWKGGLKL